MPPTAAVKLPVLVRVAVSISSISLAPQRATYSVLPDSTIPPAPVSPVMFPADVPSKFLTEMVESVAAPVTNTWL